jgi:hypothetical protein
MPLEQLPDATIVDLLLKIDIKSRLSVRRSCKDLREPAANSVEVLRTTTEGELDPSSWRVFKHACHLWVTGLRTSGCMDSHAVHRAAHAIRGGARRIQKLTLEVNRTPQYDIVTLLQVGCAGLGGLGGWVWAWAWARPRCCRCAGLGGLRLAGGLGGRPCSRAAASGAGTP